MALIIFFPLGIFAVVFSIQSIIYIRRVSLWAIPKLVQHLFSETLCSCWWPCRFGKDNFNSRLQLYRLNSFVFHSLCFIWFWRLGSFNLSATTIMRPRSNRNSELRLIPIVFWIFWTLFKGRRLIGLDEYPKINFTNMTTTVSFELPTSPSTISVTTIRKF